MIAPRSSWAASSASVHSKRRMPSVIRSGSFRRKTLTLTTLNFSTLIEPRQQGRRNTRKHLLHTRHSSF
jgi:hypothetical protein